VSNLGQHATARKRSPRHERAPNPGSSRVPPSIATDLAAISVYSGRDRLGVYRRIAGRILAVDRLGRPIGQYSTEIEAQNAISAAARAAS
jgi:hypothetical protein